MSSCSEEEPCTGFETEPKLSFHIQEGPLKLQVTSSNGLRADFKMQSNDTVLSVPLDMNGEFLKMDVFTNQYEGRMIFSYQIDVEECEKNCHQLLNVTRFKLSDSSTFRNVYNSFDSTASKFVDFGRSGISLQSSPYLGDGEYLEGGSIYRGNLYLKP